MNEYDKILRENFRAPKAALLKSLLQVEAVSIKALLTKVHQTVVEREADSVLEIVTADGQRFIAHLEWQSSNDPKMALRMAMYDLMLHQTYGMDVLGMVFYVGMDKLDMKSDLSFFGFHYHCQVVDVRNLNHEIFLDSDDPGELILAILAGNETGSQKLTIIKRILGKLQSLLGKNPAELRKRLKQLELLSLLRGKNIQEQVVKEEQNMPVTIDITQDLRYRQGEESGMEKGMEKTAVIMLKEGLGIAVTHKVTGLEMQFLEKIALQIQQEQPSSPKSN
jgi:hypothetical protein